MDIIKFGDMLNRMNTTAVVRDLGIALSISMKNLFGMLMEIALNQ